MHIIVSIGLFVIAILLISWGADKVIDIIKDAADAFKLSAVALTFFVMGVDLEESIASWSAAAANLSEIAVGNIIGNSIISITFCFSLPALFFPVVFKKISAKYFYFLLGLGTINIVVMIFPSQLLLWGIVALVLYCWYVLWNLQILKNNKVENVSKIKERREIRIKENNIEKNEQFNEVKNEENEKQDNRKEDKKNDREIEEEIEQKLEEEKQEEIHWYELIIAIIGIVALIGGSKLLIFSVEDLINQTGISEAFFGVGIVAAATNVEEYFLLFKSIKKKRVEIGIAALMGKIMWNLGFNLSITLFILAGISHFSVVNTFSLKILLNTLFLGIILLPGLALIGIKQKKMGRIEAILLLSGFLLYLVILFWK
ncbi:MAG: hypothetical protein K9W44_14270 [Candidatus Lokiarchaeota archaeon]|nr:hypothetical protein [Candidatus Harpocratesius repetitus]